MRSYAIADGNHTAAPIASLTTTYEYTGYERTRESVTAGDTLQQRRTYHYDPFGRLHQLDELEGTATRTTNILYDANGNMLSRSDADDASASEYFDYDPWDHMTAMHEGAAAAPPVARYEYDPSGMRIRELGTSRGDVEAFYADGALLEERTPLGALVSHYHEGPLGTLRFDGGNGEVSYFHTDASGSTMALTGAAGATNQTTTLDPWGAVESQTGTSGNRELFTGHRTDTETGLVYMGARYYDPALGQFTTADSYLGEPSEPGSMQRYMYANANPGRYWDPDGHLADELASGTSMSWGEYSATDGGNSNAAYQPLQTESVVGADVTGYRAALTSQINSGARDMMAIGLKEIRGLDWERAFESFLEGAAMGVGVGLLIAAIPVMICAGPVFAVLAVAGALALGGMAIEGLVTGGLRAYDDYQNAVATGSDHPLLRTMAVTLGRSTGATEGYEALTGRDAITGRSLTMEERNDRLSESASSVGGELGAGVGAFAGRRAMGTGFCFVAGTLVAMTSTAYAQPIEDVRVGDRVEVTAEQESTCSHDAREDQVRVSFVFANERAGWDTVYLDKLVSRAEAESLGYEVGASVWVDGSDFGAAGWAQVSAVEPVHVEAGAGCVVYATVEHQNGELVRLDLSDGSEVLGTAGHRYWSATRGGWFEARELREGEALRTPSGVVHVASSEVIDALAPVFNIEVEGAHEYFVGEGEVLVHNGIDCRGRPADATSSADGERLRQSLARREADVRPGVQPYEVGTYGDLTARSRPHDGLQIDHQTSHASNVRREQNRLGRLLSTEEREALRMNSPAVAVPTRWHEQHSRTYGGRNTRAQVARDARYPSIGVALDTAAMVRHAAPEHREAARRAAEAMRSVARRRGRRR